MRVPKALPPGPGGLVSLTLRVPLKEILPTWASNPWAVLCLEPSLAPQPHTQPSLQCQTDLSASSLTEFHPCLWSSFCGPHCQGHPLSFELSHDIYPIQSPEPTARLALSSASFRKSLEQGPACKVLPIMARAKEKSLGLKARRSEV